MASNVNILFIIIQIKVPVLIELGEVDLRVPPSQGKELYFYLKAAGKKTK